MLDKDTITIYRIEKDGTETVIGCADNTADASMIVDADKENVDWEAGYHWKNDIIKVTQ